jgi:uncharacterized protein YbjT (DUF2867 family)
VEVSSELSSQTLHARSQCAPSAAESTPLLREHSLHGAEVLQGDLDDLPSLKRAFAGAHGVFGVTNFWEHFSPEREFAQAGNIARAAQDVGAGHVIWSTLEDTRERVPLSDARMPTHHDRYKVPHFDAKGEADALFQGVPTTFLRTTFFWDNLIHFGMGPKRGADGRLTLSCQWAIGSWPASRLRISARVHSASSGGGRISSGVRSALPASISPEPT